MTTVLCQSHDRRSGRLFIWLGIVCFASQYRSLLAAGQLLGVDSLSSTTAFGVATNHWIEILLYCPVVWLALSVVNGMVFAASRPGSSPEEVESFGRRKLIGEFAIALWLYGAGVHIANVIEIWSREHEGLSSGSLYALIYFLDERFSHLLQFVPLFFVIGWFIWNAPLRRWQSPRLALLFGTGYGVERALSLIEGDSWFLGGPAALWLVSAALIRVYRCGSWRRGWEDFFVRFGISVGLTISAAHIGYPFLFGGFVQPSALGDARIWVGVYGWVVFIAAASLFFLVEGGARPLARRVREAARLSRAFLKSRIEMS